MLRELTIVLAGILILAYAIDFLFSHLDDPQEPRRVSSHIPIIGHVLGLLRHGFGYYGITRFARPVTLAQEQHLDISRLTDYGQ